MKKLVLTLALAAALNAPLAPAAEIDVRPVLNHYAELVHANYSDALNSARDLRTAIDAFLAAPSAASQQTAQNAWRTARESYGQTEAFRFYGGPIDDENGPEGRLNAWPMDESYVDSVEGAEGAGLINDRSFAITKASITDRNERGGEENIATGYHAIEFLLWGQDKSETGPGNRAYTDFVDGKAANADRRRLYLKTVAELLVDDLDMLAKAWRPGSRVNYRARFVDGGSDSLRNIFVAMGSLSRGELAGERLEVALNSQDQEDEHSCFSDNTHRDAVLNATGIENVWLGRYVRPDGSTLTGPSPRDLVAAKNPAQAERTSAQIAASVAAAKTIQAPFDREIVGAKDAPGRQRIQKTVNSLVQQSKDLVAAANAVGITKLTLVQP
jgi:putative iron-regulated protein